MQLTNIIRDVGDDARRGRIYLPVSELQRFDVKAHELLRREAPWGYSERFTALMRFQAERAHAAYDEALSRCCPTADRAAQKPGLMMANIYRTLLREIEAAGLPGAAPAHLADAAAQAVDRHAARTGVGSDTRVGRPMRLAVVGGGWAGPGGRGARHRGAATPSRCSRWRARLGGRAREVDVDGPGAGQRPAHPDRRLPRTRWR